MTERFDSSLRHLLAELGRLDLLLRTHATSAGPVAQREIETLLARPVGAPRWLGEPARDTATADELWARFQRETARIAAGTAASLRDGVFLRLTALADRFGLPPEDIMVVLICLAPELDRRYDRVYGHIQGDPSSSAPTVELVLALIHPVVERRLTEGRARLLPLAPLRHHQLVLVDPGNSLLGSGVRLAERVVRFLLDDDRLDERLEPFARLVVPEVGLADLPLDPGVGAHLAGLAAHAHDELVLYLKGPPGSGQQAAAAACCHEWGATLLVVSGLPPELLPTLAREARLQGAVLYFDDVPAEFVARHPSPVFVAGAAPVDVPAGLTAVTVEFPPPDHDQRLLNWSAALEAVPVRDPDVATLAATFRLTGGQIDAAVAAATSRAWARNPGDVVITDDDLRAACRDQTGATLAQVARRVVPRHTWADLVLPPDRAEQLREIYHHVRHRALVHDTWGFRRTLGRGLAVLFTGPPGTGKTMAAEVLAHELGLELYAVDLSTVVSKYVGDTEKNLSRIFDEAHGGNAILFFDEADALFGRRTQVRDAHDRFANTQTGHLLQKLEQHEGVVVLATNLRKNLDEAFARRLAFAVDFPVPGRSERHRIWSRIWPPDTPRDDLDAEYLADRIDVPGGNIRNIALSAAFLAAADGGRVTMDHVLQAARREYQKMGKVAQTPT